MTVTRILNIVSDERSIQILYLSRSTRGQLIRSQAY